MLPQCVLDPPRRSGRRHAKAAAAYTLDRLKRWEEGERVALWETRQQPLRSGRRAPTAEERRDMATNLAREGFDGKACAALLATGLLPETAETVAALRRLHPQRPPPSMPAMHDLPPAPEIVPEVVAKALRSFPAASAPGPSGLRASHLLEACTAGGSAGFLEQLAAVTSLLARGQACPDAAAVLAGAGLVAVPKQKGGARPIAIGEILRRLTGKCLMSHVRARAREHFFPAQVGVAVPAGAETAVHAVRAWVARNQATPNKVLLKLDYENAFNRVDRQRVLSAVTAHFPELARWAAWCYTRPTSLRFGQSVLLSACGVQQGDPLGPLFFAAAIHPMAQELKAGLDLSVFYLDDGVLAGDVAAVGAALAHVERRAAEQGMSLNLTKCELVAVGPVSDADLARHLPPELLRKPDGGSRLLRNFELLGAPVGDAAFTTAHTSARVRSAAGLLEAVGELEDPQVGLRLLRACAGHCRLVHSMRCSPPQPQQLAFQEFDRLVQACFTSLTGLHLDHSRWEQARRSISQAGLGLRSTQADAPAAYLASIGGCAEQCEKMDCRFPAWQVGAFPEVQQALEALNSQGAAAITADTALALRQKALTASLDTANWERQLASATLTERAGSGRRMEPAAFVAELRQRLHMPDAPADVWCPRCDGILDTHSHHAGLCTAGGERTLRHNALRDILASWAGRAGMQPEKEKPGLLLPQRPDDSSNSRRRPADIFLPSYLGTPAALDLAVTGPQRQGVVGEAAQKSLAAATAYADLKKAHLDTAQLCQAQGVRFLPLVAETTGAWEPEAGKLIAQVARATAVREGANPAALHAELLQELCVAARSARARAALRRRAEVAEEGAPSAASAAATLLVAGS